MTQIRIKKSIETTGMEAMRKEFVTLLSEKQIEFDKTCIKQSKQDLGKGIILATLKGEPQASIFWLRSMTEEGKKVYSLLTAKAASELDFSEYQTEEPVPAEPATPAKKEKRQKKSKKQKEEVIPEDPITHPAPETEEAPQEQQEAPAENLAEQELFNERIDVAE